MKLKISIVIFVLMSFLNMGAVSIGRDNSFHNLETITMSNSEFIECGIKLQYKTQENIDNEIDRIKKHFNEDVDLYCEQLDKNKFKLYNDDFEININLWNDDNFTYVDVVFINENNKYRISDLKKIIKKLENNKLEDVQYFSFYKGKVNYMDKNQFKFELNQIMNEAYISDVNILDISNGCTGTGYCKDGTRVNCSITKYDSGSYIIVSTPIIFTTY